MPGTRRPFSCRAEMHAKGACNHFEPDGTVPFDSIRTVSIMVDAQGRSPRPDSTRTPSGCGCGWQAGRLPEGANFAINGKIPLLPFSPSPLFPSPLSYLPTRTITRLHGYPRYLDSFFTCARTALSHTPPLLCASFVCGQSVNGWHWLQKRGTQGHSSESPRRPALTQGKGKGKSTSKLPLPLKLPRSCTVDFRPFMLDDVCSRPTPAYAHVEV